jgi:ATP-dependent Clp endopeptidase proteolytic subunit ClpP
MKCNCLSIIIFAFGGYWKKAQFCDKYFCEMDKFWNVVKHDGVAKVLLYGDVGDGCQVDSARVVTELLSLAGYAIEIHINSRGGDVFSGIAIYNALKNSESDIAIYIDGVAASIAAIIALCGKPLYMSRHAKLMLHAVSGGAWGNAQELRATADTIEELQNELANMIAEKVNESPEQIVAKYFDGTDHWISATEADALGLIDGIYDMPAAPPTETEEDIYNFINQLRVVEHKTENMLSEEIKKMPAFEGKTDDQIVNEIKEYANSATLVDSLKQANDQYKARIAELESKEVTAILDKAVSEGRITKEQVPTYTALMASDRTNTEALLASLPKRDMRIVNFIGEDGAKGDFSAAWDELDKAGKLADLKASDPALFAQKFKEKFGVECNV